MEKIIQNNRVVSVVGLGEVGLKVAIAFAKVRKVIGFDTSEDKIRELTSSDHFSNINISFTDDAKNLNRASFHIIAVPTPVNQHHQPDLSYLKEASEILANQLKKNDIVVYESSVYPGATEEICIPILEKLSGLKCGKDFGVGYSPERINPEDEKHTIENIPKIVSASDANTLKIIVDEYGKIVNAGIHTVSSIKVAEAAKLVENTQRDLNISFVNEMAIILQQMGISASETMAACKTKWNFIPYEPGLVGGHCIGINSYYLYTKSVIAGYYPKLIPAGRQVNEYMPVYLAEMTTKKLLEMNINVNGAKIAVFGFSYKANSADVRDTKVMALIHALRDYHCDVIVYDPVASQQDTNQIYNLSLTSWSDLKNLDAIIITTSHKAFYDLSADDLKLIMRSKSLLMDFKSIFPAEKFKKSDIHYWRI